MNRLFLFLPFLLLAMLFGPGAAPAEAEVSCSQCLVNYQICQANSCGDRDPPRLCDRCDTLFYQCLDTCVEICPETTEIKTYYSPLYKDYFIRTWCFRQFPWDDPEVHDEEMWTWQYLQKQITQNADCTITETTLQQFNYHDYCYRRRFQECCLIGESCFHKYPSVDYTHNFCDYW